MKHPFDPEVIALIVQIFYNGDPTEFGSQLAFISDNTYPELVDIINTKDSKRVILHVESNFDKRWAEVSRAFEEHSSLEFILDCLEMLTERTSKTTTIDFALILVMSLNRKYQIDDNQIRSKVMDLINRWKELNSPLIEFQFQIVRYLKMWKISEEETKRIPTSLRHVKSIIRKQCSQQLRISKESILKNQSEYVGCLVGVLKSKQLLPAIIFNLSR